MLAASPTLSPDCSGSPSPRRAFNPRPYNASQPSLRELSKPRTTQSSSVSYRSSATQTSRPSSPDRQTSSNRAPLMVDAGTQYSPPESSTNGQNLQEPSASITESRPAVVTTAERNAPGSASSSGLSDSDSSGKTDDPSPDKPASPTEQPVVSPRSPNPRVDPVPQTTQQQAAPASLIQNRSTSSSDGRDDPSKRVRSEGESRVMPIKYEDCNVKDLGKLISDMLMELVRINDALPLRDGGLTRFHSRAPPTISVQDYLTRLIIHATLSPPILLSMVYYIDRLCALYPTFNVSSLTVHRFLIAAATVASKGLSDSFWTNSTYARVGGVSLKELAILELEFLTRTQWRIVPKPEVLVDYYRNLVSRNAAFIMEDNDQDGDSTMRDEGL